MSADAWAALALGGLAIAFFLFGYAVGRLTERGPR